MCYCVFQNFFSFIENKKKQNTVDSSEQINKQITLSSDFYMNFSTEEDLTEDFSVR